MMRVLSGMLFCIVFCTAVLHGQNTKPVRKNLHPADTTKKVSGKSSVLFIGIGRCDTMNWMQCEAVIAGFKERKQQDSMITFAEQVSIVHSRSAWAHYLYADAQLEYGDPEGAIEAARTALLYDHTFVRARSLLAEALALIRRNDEALAQLDTAIVQNPRYAQVYAQRAVLLSRTGRVIESLKDYRAAAELTLTSERGWTNLARACMLAGHYDEAVDAIKYVLIIAPDNPDTYLMLGEAYIGAGKVKDAYDAYNQFLKKFPDHPKASDIGKLQKSLEENNPQLRPAEPQKKPDP